jgi:hypothetical protein
MLTRRFDVVLRRFQMCLARHVDQNLSAVQKALISKGFRPSHLRSQMCRNLFFAVFCPKIACQAPYAAKLLHFNDILMKFS